MQTKISEYVLILLKKTTQGPTIWSLKLIPPQFNHSNPLNTLAKLLLLLLLISCWNSLFFHPIIITINLLYKLTLSHPVSSIQKKVRIYKTEREQSTSKNVPQPSSKLVTRQNTTRVQKLTNKNSVFRCSTHITFKLCEESFRKFQGSVRLNHLK